MAPSGKQWLHIATKSMALLDERVPGSEAPATAKLCRPFVRVPWVPQRRATVRYTKPHRPVRVLVFIHTHTRAYPPTRACPYAPTYWHNPHEDSTKSLPQFKRIEALRLRRPASRSRFRSNEHLLSTTIRSVRIIQRSPKRVSRHRHGILEGLQKDGGRSI